MRNFQRDRLQDNPAPKPDTNSAEPAPDQPPRKLLDEARDAIRVRHYSIRTEASYVGWIRRCILFHGKQHPRALGGA